MVDEENTINKKLLFEKTVVNKFVSKIFKENLYTFSLYTRQIASTIVLLLIAKYLSIYDFGLFSSYKNIAVFCLLFADLEFSNYILVSSKANIKEVKLKISLFLLNAIFLVMIISFSSIFFKLDNHILFFLVLLRTFFDTTFFGLILPYFQATRKLNTIAKINIIYNICMSLVAIVAYVLKLSLAKFLLLNIGIGVINFLQCSYYAKINYFLVLTYIKRFFKMLDSSIWGYIGSTLTNYMYSQIPSLYVAIFLPKTEAALYFAAYTIASLVNLFSAAQAQKMLPEMINASSKDIKELLRKNLILIWTVLTGVLVFFIIFGKPILNLLYSKAYYTNSYPILILSIISNIFIANGVIFGAYMTAIQRQGAKIRMKLETSVITIIGLCLLYKYGIYGAVTSFFISSIYVTIRYAHYSFSTLKQNLITEKLER